ncbi:MAG: NTP transferase domain-containing protein [Nitrososphaeria archaeon]
MSTGSPRVTGIVLADELTYITLPNRFYSTASESSVLEYMLDALWTVFDRMVIVSSIDPPLDIMERIDSVGARVVMDKSRNVINMVQSALELVETPVVLVVSGDRPLLKPSVLFTIGYNLGDFECVIPRWKDMSIDPLLAAYRTTSLTKSMKRKEPPLNLESLVKGLDDVLYVSVENELNIVDPELYSFVRVKGSVDIGKVLQILGFRGSNQSS